MDTHDQALEDYERWFYGGSPPEGDAMTAPSQATEKPARAIGARRRTSAETGSPQMT